MKKSITLLLTLVMLLTTVVTTTAATPVLTDVAGEKCETAVTVLAGLGIVEGRSEGKYEPNASLTRAEMVTIILRAMNMEAAVGQDVFEDVPSTHWAYANVAAAYQLGIINGMSPTTFAPDAPVTDEQAIKMVVCALGYGVHSEAAGGYPSGYLAKAAQLNILKGIKVEGEMNRGDMAILLYNSLNVELAIRSSYGDDLEFDIKKDVTLLTYYLKAEYYTEVVNATPMGSVVASAPSLKSDELVAGTTVMMKGETNAQDFLGMRVDIYAREDDMTGKPVVLAIVPRATTAVLDVNAQDIEAASIANGTFEYENEAGKLIEEDIKGAKVVKNGSLIDSPADADVTPAIGAVRLIRNTGNAYEYILVEAYENKIVNTVNEKTDKISFKDSTNLVVDFDDKTMSIEMTDAAGKALKLSDLEEWNVLSIAKSADGKVLRIRVSTATVEGAITESDAKNVKIGDKTYPIMAAPLLEGAAKVGDEGVYYLDITGTIVAADAAKTTGRAYAWLTKAEMGEGIDTTASIKIFNQDGDWKVYELAERVKFNGVSTKSEDLLDKTKAVASLWADYARPSLVDSNGDVVPQLIAYKENADGKINVIETAENRTNTSFSDEVKTDDSTFSMDWYINSNNNGTKDSGYVATFNGDHAGANATARTQYMGGTVFGRVTIKNIDLFIVPDDPTDERGYSVSQATNVINSTEAFRARPCLSFYDVNEDYQTGVLVYRQDLEAAKSGGSVSAIPTSDGGLSNAALVTGIGTILDEDGATKTVLKLMTDTGEVTVGIEDGAKLFYHKANANPFADPDWYILEGTTKITGDDRFASNRFGLSTTGRPTMFIDAKDLEPGDVIRYKTTATGDLKDGNVDFRINYNDKVALRTFTGKGGYSGKYGVNSVADGVNNLTAEALYTSNYAMVHGVVENVGTNNFMVKAVLTKQWGYAYDAAERDNHIARYTISGTTYLEWNTRTQEASSISVSDLELDDEVIAFTSMDLKTAIIVKLTDGRN